ncbi:non-specific lipid-transfer protein-like protein isoform X2 [Gossypium australe]|uniref:Non-specific lipid-transfer protein-like protein isoform X2 n=1 Tax=Gossypium australe TaxID=47621 RepID=A0A5B6V285_9ROSI|nr:non-specific lipid-transfer protein-like protein isoform X2 [Gossypium australe]
MFSTIFTPPPPPSFNDENHHIWVVKMKINLQDYDLREVMNANVEPSSLRTNPTIAQIRQHSDDHAKKFKAMSCAIYVLPFPFGKTQTSPCYILNLQMALENVKLGLALVFVTMLCGYKAMAQSGCTSVLLGLAPCLNYITSNSTTTPSSTCCSQLSSVVQSQPQCLCSVLNGGASSLGVTINQTRALSLPGACNVQTPPVSRCNAANGPASPPASSAVSPSSADSSDDTPSIPSGTGSKTVPTTEGSISNGRIMDKPLALTLFTLFIASYVSIIALY